MAAFWQPVAAISGVEYLTKSIAANCREAKLRLRTSPIEANGQQRSSAQTEYQNHSMNWYTGVDFTEQTVKWIISNM